MPANTAPIFTDTPSVGAPKAISAANTSSAGGGTIGTDIFLIFSAGADGSYVSKVQVQAVATAASTATTATVARLFLSTQSSGATTAGTNTWLLAEVSLPTVTADAPTAATNRVDIPLNVAIPSGYHLLMTTHHAPAANTSQHAVVFGGDY